MTFVASKVLWFLVEPGNALFLLLVVGVALSWTRWRRWGRLLTLWATVAFLAIMVLPLGALLALPLESRFWSGQAEPDRVDGIVLLGGASSLKATAAWGRVSLNDNAERITEFVALARRHPEARLIFTGGSGSLQPGALREADVVEQVMHDIGFDVGRVTFERAARNKYENARNSLPLANPAAGEVWLLVTSAQHMPRAVGCFRQVGWDVVPHATDYRLDRHKPYGIGLKFAGKLNRFNAVFREWLGLIAYRVLGRTNALLPGPAA